MKYQQPSFLTIFLIRCLDIFFSFVALLIFSPLVLLVALILRCTGEGEVLYLQTRIGRRNKEFKLVKFATMKKLSPSIGAGELTLPNDSRVLPFGRFLRRYKINELPQLWNVLVGDLSLIGPRPQTLHYFERYSLSDREYIAQVRPGLSGVGSILFRDEEGLLAKVQDPLTFDEHIITPYKGKIEHWFVLNQSFSLYIELIFITLVAVLIPSSRIHQLLLPRLPSPPPQLSNLLGE